MKKRFVQIFLALVLVTGNLSYSAVPAGAQIDNQIVPSSSADPSLSLQQDGSDLVLQWQLSQSAISAASTVDAASSASALSIAEAAVDQMPHMPYGGYMIPMQLQTVILDDAFVVGDDAIEVEFEQIESLPYRRSIEVAPVEEPKAAGWDRNQYPGPAQEFELPSQSVFVLREGRVRGTRVAVVAFSPIFANGDGIQVAYDFSARLPNARPFDGGIDTLLAQNFTDAVSSASLSAMSAPPTNPAAAQNAVKVHVVTPGIQVISGADLIANGVAAGTSLNALQVAYRGSEIAIELWDSGNNGTLDASDAIRFFARSREHSMTVGDDWNEEEIYWLTYNGTAGKRMVTRNVLTTASNAPIRPIAIEKGIWEENAIYESTMPGADGDNWFHERMIIAPEQASNPASFPRVTINLNNRLPLATSSMASKFTLTGSANSVAKHSLQVDLNSVAKTVDWTNLQYYETWSHTISSTVSHPSTIELTLLPGKLNSDIRFDKIYWEQPVNLDFGNVGAAFTGVAGTWRYQLANVSADAALYDITDPLLPQRLILPGGSNPQFEDGPEPRNYLLATAGELGVPELSSHTPVAWLPTQRGDALYIGYDEYRAEIEPLLAFRRAQGYEAKFVSLQSIYDSWSFGRVSPEAVRNMLQFAVANWALKPISVVVIGDTTSDPKNYLGRQDGNQNRNIFPTFLEANDPWLGETACDSCFVQLDDEHPLDGILDKDFLIDMWIGRFSIQDTSQLKAVVDKILSYEQPADIGLDASWRQQSVFVADNYVRSDCTLDSAGDFAKGSEDIIANYQSPAVRSTKIFYDPSSTLNPSECPSYYNPQVKSGRYATPASVKSAAIQAYQRGAGLITFDGHSNHFQNGRTEKDDGYIMGFNEILQMKNANQLPILMEMTCYTGQFQYVSTTGTTMDERFQRQPNGGAIAIFAPAGLSVATGHKFLQQGFHDYLWSQPTFSSRMGELVEASYYSLFENSSCCQDVRYTFLLLGDPLTRALVMAPNRLFLPVTEQ